MKLKIFILIIIIFNLFCIKKEKYPLVPPLESKSLFGVDMSLSPDDDTFLGYDHEKIEKLIADMGIKWTRETFVQSGIEYKKGEYDWSKYDTVIKLHLDYGINIIGNIYGASSYVGHPIQNDRNRLKMVPKDPETGYPDEGVQCSASLSEWIQFVKKVVERYDGDGIDDAYFITDRKNIKFWEGWNEPNYWSEHGGFWCKAWQRSYDSDDIKHLIKLHKAFYKAVKETDRTAKILAPSMLKRSSYGKIDHQYEYYCRKKELTSSDYDFANYHRHNKYIWEDGWDVTKNIDKKIIITEISYQNPDTDINYSHDKTIKFLKYFIEGGYLIKEKRLFRLFHYFKQLENNIYIDLKNYTFKETGKYMKIIFTKLGESTPVERKDKTGFKWFRFEKDGRNIYAAWSLNGVKTINLPVKTEKVLKTTIDNVQSILSSENNLVSLELTEEPIFIEEK